MFEVKHFLGLANYFRDNVPNFSVLAITLQKLVIGYTKSMRNRKVKLLPRYTLATFIYLKDLLDRSQKLFYFDIEAGDQIHLKTNASDYGILQKGVEIPIRFLSCSLAKVQLNWSTPEKECFAIWYAVVVTSTARRTFPYPYESRELNARILHRISEGLSMAYVHTRI
jgi:hypothetical protein